MTRQRRHNDDEKETRRRRFTVSAYAMYSLPEAPLSESPLDRAEDGGGNAIRHIPKAGALLASSLDLDTTVANVAQLVVSHMADCVVIYLGENIHTLRLGFVAHRDPAKAACLRHLIETPSFQWSPRWSVYHALTSGRAQLLSRVTDEMLNDWLCDIHHLPQLQSVQVRSAIVLPLQARGRILGAMCLSTSGDHARQFDANDLVIAEDWARCASLAIDNARRYTEMAQTHQVLSERTHELDTLIQCFPLPIVHMDLQGKVIRWNGAAEQLTGWTKDEVVGKRNPMLAGETTDSAQTLLSRLVQGESVDGLIVRRKRRDGESIELSKWASPIKDANGNVRGIIALYLDVTERNRFLHIATHELGNPLASIKVLLSLLHIYVQNGAPHTKLRTQLSRLTRETNRFTELLEEVLSAFQTHEGTLAIDESLLDVRDFLQSFIYQQYDSDSLITLDVCDEAVYVRGDRRRLGQVLSNLLDNARKYSGPGTEIHVRLQADADGVIISVTDHGIGIPSSELPHIFDEFYRVKDAALPDPHHERYASNEQNLGLGLYICREIVLQHRGTIWAESEVGHGSTFYVKLPRQRSTR